MGGFVQAERSAFGKTFRNIMFEEGSQATGTQGDHSFIIFERSHQKKNIDQLVDNEITLLLKNSTLPILVVPPKCNFHTVQNICFFGNAEGLSDHPLIHRMIARFLPRAHQIKNRKIKHIHWNNVFQIPQLIPAKYQLTPRQLNRQIEESNIQLVVLPIPQQKPWWRNLWEISFIWNSNVPVLVIPV